ncbi:MAG: DUF1684 domain-containing protein [Anaerolineales bacterium]|nr:DUF1684 domain-containing protein [Anaerolineales bacterium]
MKAEQMQELQAWRTQREASLRGEYSWLALAGLGWLEDGANSVGSAHDSRVQLPPRFPSLAGVLHLQNGVAELELAPGAAWRLGEQPLTSRSPALHDDSGGQPDLLYLDDLRLVVIQRAGRLAARLWDPQHPTRLNFPGCIWYPPASQLRLLARVEPYLPPKPVQIAQITGGEYTAHMQAALAFEIDGQIHRLDAEHTQDGRYTLMFKDATAGKTTYGAGRFLTTEPPVGDTVILDFNYAYSPPCAFTEFATCPLPVPQNILPIPIEAGEQTKPH